MDHSSSLMSHASLRMKQTHSRRLVYENSQIYQLLIDALAARGTSATVEAFVVGSLGRWDADNERVLRALDISPKYAKLMRKIMCTSCIKWSRDIYVKHLTDTRQF
ncbi:hypothetical protein JTE90_020549 [Oedothorax gibbosus]|uniref:Uncharacterized protein n=1 Tax=Oedothorax gibbosus TaxID=931172 RepID=A0AAV6VVX5_9ARAC|nr:hypothetical protein JTE90_020549 [Oedothorax gibbosus]